MDQVIELSLLPLQVGKDADRFPLLWQDMVSIPSKVYPTEHCIVHDVPKSIELPALQFPTEEDSSGEITSGSRHTTTEER